MADHIRHGAPRHDRSSAERIEDELGISHSWGQGPEVIVLSNPLADPVEWSAGARGELVARGYRVTAFEHRPRRDDWRGVIACVQELVGRREAPVSLIGWSQGAVIAQEVALAVGDRVRAVVLLAPYGRQNEIDRLLQQSWDHLAEDGPDTLRAVLRFLTAFPAERLADDALIRNLMSPQVGWAQRPDRERRRRAGAFIESYQERLGALATMQAPALVMGFELDADTFAARAREVAEALPNARYLELAGEGHAAPLTSPSAVWPAVLDHLGRHHPPRT